MEELIEILDELEVNEESFRELDLNFDFINNAPFSNFLEPTGDMVSDEEFDSFLTNLIVGLQANTTLETIYMSWNFLKVLSSEYARNLFDVIGRLPGLEKFVVESHTVSTLPSHIKLDYLLARMLRSTSRLKTLKIDGMADFVFTSQNVVFDFAQHIPNSMEELQIDSILISSDKFSENALNCLLTSLKHCPRLRKLHLPISLAHESFLKWNLVSDYSLGQFLAASESLQHLSLKGWGLKDAHCRAIAKFCPPSLELLDISYNPAFFSSGKEEILELTQRHHTIKDLKLGGKLCDSIDRKIQCQLFQNVRDRRYLSTQSSLEDWIDYLLRLQLPHALDSTTQCPQTMAMDAIFDIVRRNPYLCKLRN